MDRDLKVALGIAAGAFVLGNVIPSYYADAQAAQPRLGSAMTVTHGPTVVGKYRLVVDVPHHPNEDEIGWNCYTDGNLYCGPSAQVKATGFSRPGWRVTCVYYAGEVVNAGRYVMCSDGSVYVKSPR